MVQKSRSFSPLSLTVSFFLAFGLWTYVTMEKQYTSTVEVPLSVQLPQNRAIETLLPKTVRAQVQGAGWDLVNMYFSFTPRCEVVLSDKLIPANDSLILSQSLLSQSLNVPAQVNPLRIIPDTLSISIGYMGSKKVPVRPDTRLGFRDGYMLNGRVKLEPDSVVITANEKLLKDLHTWRTVPIVLDDLHKPLSGAVELSDSLSNIIRLSEKRVNAGLDVQEIAELTLDYLPITITAAPRNHTIILMPGHVSLTVRGGIDAVSRIDPSEFQARVNYKDLVDNPTGIIRPEIIGPRRRVEILQPVPARIRFVRRISS